MTEGASIQSKPDDTSEESCQQQQEKQAELDPIDRVVEGVQECWQYYRSKVREHQGKLLLAEEGLRRLLFFAPSSGEEPSRWSEILFGVLQLNELGMELATRDGNLTAGNPFGTSVALPKEEASDFPVAGVRIALTVLQCLWPILQELVRARSSPETTVRRQAGVRCILERIRFLLRLSLLAHYWYKMLPNDIQPGLLLDGGLFLDRPAPSVDKEYARLEREQYMGARTGRRVTRNPPIEETKSELVTPKMQHMFGELLYIFRPFFQGEALDGMLSTDVAGQRKVWIICLAMDVASLISLQRASGIRNVQQPMAGNRLTQEEWKRRRMRLLLYLLRAPIWETTTRPSVERIGAVTERVPLVGGLLQNYLWDWLYYWKLYRAEEG